LRTLRGKKLTSRTAAETRAMREYREAHPVCEACGMENTRDAHHIVTEKTGGPAEEWNLLGLCAWCHQEIHSRGWLSFGKRYPHLEGKIVAARIRMGRKTEK